MTKRKPSTPADKRQRKKSRKSRKGATSAARPAPLPASSSAPSASCGGSSANTRRHDPSAQPMFLALHRGDDPHAGVVSRLSALGGMEPDCVLESKRVVAEDVGDSALAAELAETQARNRGERDRAREKARVMAAVVMSESVSSSSDHAEEEEENDGEGKEEEEGGEGGNEEGKEDGEADGEADGDDDLPTASKLASAPLPSDIPVTLESAPLPSSAEEKAEAERREAVFQMSTDQAPDGSTASKWRSLARSIFAGGGPQVCLRMLNSRGSVVDAKPDRVASLQSDFALQCFARAPMVRYINGRNGKTVSSSSVGELIRAGRRVVPVVEPAHASLLLGEPGLWEVGGMQLRFPPCVWAGQCAGRIFKIRNADGNGFGAPCTLSAFMTREEFVHLAQLGVHPRSVQNRPCILCYRTSMQMLHGFHSIGDGTCAGKRILDAQLFAEPVGTRGGYRRDVRVPVPRRGDSSLRWVVPCVAMHTGLLRWTRDPETGRRMIDQSRLLLRNEAEPDFRLPGETRLATAPSPSTPAAV